MNRPNILIIQTDQQRWDALGANGNPHIITPNLDRLAAEGFNFDHYFVQHPLCMPSRVSFLAGQYPATLGIPHMGVPVPETTVTLPHLVRPYGYHTGVIGKLHFLPHANRDHRVPHPAYGFDHREISDEPGVYEDAYRAWARHKDPSQMDNLSVGLPPATQTWYETMGWRDDVIHPRRQEVKGAIAFPGREDMTHSAFVGEQAVAYLERAPRPFMCIASFYSPHNPWVAPRRYLDLYDPDQLPRPHFSAEEEARRANEPRYSDERLQSAKHGYYAMVSEVDHHVGQILGALGDEIENTIVVFTSDHGEWLGDHLRYTKGYPGDDPVSRVPLIMRVPGVVGGRQIGTVVEAVDVLPTLLELIGVQVPPHLQGHSLLPFFSGDSFAGPRSALMEADGWKSLRTTGFRYLLHANGTEMLWNLETDPGEHYDVARDPRYAEALAEHRHAMLVRLLNNERPLARTWPY